MVTGIQPALGKTPIVYGQRHADRLWRVQIVGFGGVVSTLSPDQARSMAVELLTYADVCDEGNNGQPAEVVA